GGRGALGGGGGTTRSGVPPGGGGGCREFPRHFGRRPQGIWLPECGYSDGVDELLRDSGLRYFFTDTHGVLFAEPRPKFGVYAPSLCPSGVAGRALTSEASTQDLSAVQ